MGAAASINNEGTENTTTNNNTFAPIHLNIKTEKIELQFINSNDGGKKITNLNHTKIPKIINEKAMSWFSKCSDKNSSSWTVHIITLLSPNTSSNKVALLLHSWTGKNRCAGFFSNYCKTLLDNGYNIIGLDFPGYGRSSNDTIPSKSGIDEEIVLGILKAFGASENVTVIADGGGVGTFFRLYCRFPKLFSGHHVLHNPIVTEHSMLGEIMLSEGCDLFCIISEGWSKDDYTLSAGNLGQFFSGVCKEEGMMERIMILPTRYEGSFSTVRGPKAENYLMGLEIPLANVSKEKGFYMLEPSEEFLNDMVSYLNSKRKEPIEKNASISSVPTKSALEAGSKKVNENFKVFIRVRPMLKREINSESCIKVEDVKDFPRTPPPQRIYVKDPSMLNIVRGNYVFNRVFVEKATQDEVFLSVASPLIHALVNDKKNVTMFAYGQTGTGKTYTMEGPNGISSETKDGLISQSLSLMFDLLNSSDESLNVSYQYVQLYNGNFLDLLKPSSNIDMKVEEVKDNNGEVLTTRVRGATINKTNNISELLNDVANGASYRASGATNMNDASSRSHAILIVILSNNTTLYMIDLAGSERNKRSGATGRRFNEATAINVALSALGRVVLNLVENNGKRGKHVSYYDNPLTHLLMPGLGGKSMTALISCITAAADSISESTQTLRFSVQASHVKNKVDAKAKKDQATKADDKIKANANDLTLDNGGNGIVPIKNGDKDELDVYGFWTNDPSATTIIFINDFKKDPIKSYKPYIDALKEIATTTLGDAKPLRILAPTFYYESEKSNGDYHASAVHTQLLALMDYLGIAKATIAGSDLGGINAIDFQLKYRNRVTVSIAQNKIIDLDAKGWKKARKKDPSWDLNCMMNVWNWVVPFDKNAKPAKEKFFKKKFKGPLMLLWPYAFKGRADTSGSGAPAYFVKAMKAQFKNKFSVNDSYGKSDVEIAQYILDASYGKSSSSSTSSGKTKKGNATKKKKK